MLTISSAFIKVALLQNIFFNFSTHCWISKFKPEFSSFTRKERRTEKGALEAASWIAFKKHLVEYKTTKNDPIDSIILWEKYLVYAVTLGCANKLSKVMKLKLKSMNLEKNMDIDYFDRMIMLNYVMNSSVNNIVKTAYSAKSAANAASMSSSGGGFGGGFSGSGGSFGGGGGGGRF